MREYTREDFATYYAGSFIRLPETKTVAQLIYGRRDDRLRLYDGPTDIPISGEQILTLPEVDRTKLEWEHVRRPLLGYRHLQGGKFLYYAYVHRSSQTAKGLNANTVRLEIPTEFASAVMCIPKPYALSVSLTQEVAQELCYPNFISSAKEAINYLKGDPVSLGLALSNDTAIVLGKRASESFILLFRGQRAAHSKDGIIWTFIKPDFKGVLERHAKI